MLSLDPCTSRLVDLRPRFDLVSACGQRVSAGLPSFPFLVGPLRAVEGFRLVPGAMNKQVAAEVGVSPNTVNKWRSRFVDSAWRGWWMTGVRVVRTQDLGCQRRLPNLTELQARARAAN